MAGENTQDISLYGSPIVVTKEDDLGAVGAVPYHPKARVK